MAVVIERAEVDAFAPCVVGYHATHGAAATALLSGLRRGEAWRPSARDGDWLGHGVYFWQDSVEAAQWWARSRGWSSWAIVGAHVQLGRCLDLLRSAEALPRLQAIHARLSQSGLVNFNANKMLDCAVFNAYYSLAETIDEPVQTARGLSLPRGRLPLWPHCGIHVGAYIQLVVLDQECIERVWLEAHHAEEVAHGDP